MIAIRIVIYYNKNKKKVILSIHSFDKTSLHRITYLDNK